MFLAVLSYIAGNAMSALLPEMGPLGRWLNPQKFNSKEHLAIVVMASSAYVRSRVDTLAFQIFALCSYHKMA